MSNTPELKENPVARMLPVIWVILLVVLGLGAYLYFTFANFPDELTLPLPVAPTITVYPTKIPTITRTPTITIKPTKVPVACYKLNIREGEFASNKCYTKTDYNNLVYYLQRFDSAQFDLETANGSIRITCNCRVPQECEFFKDSCAEAKQKKSASETNINNYRSTIRSIISRGK